MPIYEYECQSCGHILDALQKMSEDPLKFCPECGQPALKKLLSAPRFRLKGSGWYETDFKTGDKRNLHGEDKSSSDSKSDKKSDNKSDKKTESKPSTKKADSA